MDVSNYVWSVLWVILSIFYILGVLLWRLGVAISLVFFDLFAFFRNRRGLLAVLLVLIAGGIVLQEFQEEVMIATDVVWMCSVRQLGEIVNSIAISLVRIPWEFLSLQSNNIVLVITQSFVQLLDEIGLLVDLGSIASKSVGLSSVKAMIFGDAPQHIADWVSAIAALFQPLLQGIVEFFVCAWDWASNIFVSLFTARNIFSQDCTFCALDPDPNQCPIRDSFLSSAEADCNECHDFLVDGAGCAGVLADAIFLDFLSEVSGGATSFRRIFRALGCVVRSLIYPPLFIFQTFFTPNTVSNLPPCIAIQDTLNIADRESLITLWWMAGDLNIYDDCEPATGGGFSDRCCGRPAGCDFPSAGGDDLPIGFVPCGGELIAAITGDTFDDLLEILLSFFLKIINDIIISFHRIVDAFDPSVTGFDTCAKNWPIMGAPGITPGVCHYDNTDVNFELYVPDGGIHQCFQLAVDFMCDDPAANAPLLVGLCDSGVIEFLFVDVMIGLDFTVCPFVALPLYLGNPACDNNVTAFQTCLNNLANNAPIWAPFADALVAILTVITELIAGVQALVDRAFNSFECLLRCGPAEFVSNELLECFKPGCCSGSEGCEDSPGNNTFQDFYERMTSDEMPPASPKALEDWRAMLHGPFGVEPGTWCDIVLRSTPPSHVVRDNWGSYMAYFSCMAAYGIRYKIAMGCNVSDAADLGIGSTMSTFVSCAPQFAANYSRDMGSPTGIPVEPGERGSLPGWIQAIDFSAGGMDWSPDFFQPLWRNVKATSVWRRGAEFVAHYRMRAAAGAEPDELEELAAEFANDLLRFQRTRRWRNESFPEEEGEMGDEIAPSMRSSYVSANGKRRYREMSAAQFKDIPDRFWQRAAELGVLSAPENATLAVPEDARAVWEMLTERAQVQYWPRVQGFAGIMRALRMRDGRHVIGILTGRTKYVISRQEFVSARAFERERKIVAWARDDAEENRTSLIGMALGMTEYHPRQTRRRFEPFPFPAPVVLAENGTVIEREVPIMAWMRDAAAYVRVKHREYQMRREIKRAAGLHQKESWNPWIYSWLDWGIERAGYGAARVTDGLRATVARVDAFLHTPTDDPDHYWDSIAAFFADWFQCTIPENINGDAPYSPFCLFLLPEQALRHWQPLTTESKWAPEIDWPPELIATECETIFNGDQNLFSFEFSNNCNLDPAPPAEQHTCTDPGSCLTGTVVVTDTGLTFNHTAISYTFSGSADCDVNFFQFGLTRCIADDQIVRVASAVGDPEGCLVSVVENVNDTDCPIFLGENDVRVTITGSDVCTVTLTFDHEMQYTDGQLALGSVQEPTCYNCTQPVPLRCTTAPPVDPYANLRPFCPTCDYCEREYRSCADAGFADIIDSIGYILAAIPRLLEELITGGIDFTLFENLWGVTFVTLIFSANIIFILGSFCITWPAFVLQIEIIYLVPWTIFIVFGDTVPWALIIITAIIVISNRLSALTTIFAIILSTLSSIVILWFLNIVFDFAPDIFPFNLVQIVLDGLYFVDDFIPLWFFKVGSLITRLEEWNIPPNQPLPALANFCFFWQFSNLAAAALILITSPVLFRFLFRGVFAIFLAFFALVLLLFGARRRIRNIITRQRTEDNARTNNVQDTRFSAFQDRVERAISGGAERVFADVRVGWRLIAGGTGRSTRTRASTRERERGSGTDRSIVPIALVMDEGAGAGAASAPRRRRRD